jgi:hypothetical protein
LRDRHEDEIQDGVAQADDQGGRRRGRRVGTTRSCLVTSTILLASSPPAAVVLGRGGAHPIRVIEGPSGSRRDVRSVEKREKMMRWRTRSAEGFCPACRRRCKAPRAAARRRHRLVLIACSLRPSTANDPISSSRTRRVHARG